MLLQYKKVHSSKSAVALAVSSGSHTWHRFFHLLQAKCQTKTDSVTSRFDPNHETVKFWTVNINIYLSSSWLGYDSHAAYDRLVISRAKVCQMPRTNGYWALRLRMLDTVSPVFLFVMDPWISMQDWPWKLKLSKNQTPTLTLQSRSSQHTNPQCPMQYVHMMYTLLVYIYVYIYIYMCVYFAHSISWSPSSSLHCMLV